MRSVPTSDDLQRPASGNSGTQGVALGLDARDASSTLTGGSSFLTCGTARMSSSPRSNLHRHDDGGEPHPPNGAYGDRSPAPPSTPAPPNRSDIDRGAAPIAANTFGPTQLRPGAASSTGEGGQLSDEQAAKYGLNGKQREGADEATPQAAPAREDADQEASREAKPQRAPASKAVPGSQGNK